MSAEFREIETKWQTRWRDAKVFEPSVSPGTPKFLCTFPYPYTNGLPHVGHLFTSMRIEALARYKRMCGFNVLYPQGWHCTGSPLTAAAQRVREHEPTQIQILKDFGVPNEEIPKFGDPKYWITYFVPGYKKDWQAIGLSIDWRREFITTELNPRYDAFIRWQFDALKEKGLVALGKHPVVWCPKDNAAVSDHDRRSGEGETPQEFILIPFTIVGTDETVVAATLRPETLPGLTNLWASPNIEYVKATVDGATWIVSAECITKLKEQEHVVTVIGTVPGASLIGKRVTTGETGSVPILPASFPKADKGTGIVMSVPSDAPDDYIALRDIQKDEKLQHQYGLSSHDLALIKPIPIIDAGELGTLAAVKVVDDMKIVSQKERDKLEAAKKLVYRKGFYEGTMLVGDYTGERVEIAKERIKEALVATGQALKFWELTGPVVCRCLTPCVVRVVSNQWFITYGNAEWKAKTHKAVDQMRFYPEKARSQFDYVVDWLGARACSRESGLGSRLPWDQHWLIESLSDSTFYNALYTFYDILRDYPEHRITHALFDYVILGNGTPPHEDSEVWRRMREAFLYWYPVDVRNSGKDLIQSHLTFMLFTHTALLDDPNLWPRAYSVNGWVTVDGQKMSKSLGNVIPVRTMLAEYGADASRLTILNGGEGMDDPNWDSELARVTKARFAALLELCVVHVHDDARSRHTHLPVDDWFQSKVHRVIRDTTAAMDLMNFRTALQHCWFSLGNTIKQYLRLTNEKPNAAVFRAALETQIKLIQPFAPHIAAECWERLGNTTMLALESWPQAQTDLISDELEASQDLVENLAGDIRSVQTLLKKPTLSSITVIVSATWLYSFTRELREQLRESRDVRALISSLTKTYASHAVEVTKMIPMLVKEPGRLPSYDASQELELRAVHGAAEFLGKQFGCPITVERAEDSVEQKAKSAFPGKPAILLR